MAPGQLAHEVATGLRLRQYVLRDRDVPKDLFEGFVAFGLGKGQLWAEESRTRGFLLRDSNRI